MRIHPVTCGRPNAFTLMEMAVVLSIIGLIIGAVIGGQEMLRQSELQTVIGDYGKYTGAVGQFRQQYGSLPGDILDATNYWGDDPTAVTGCADATVTNGTPGTCNGNGDGDMSTSAEPYRAWQHLMLAKLIEGNYTGIASGGGTVPGINSPRSRISNSGWGFGYKAATGALATPPVAANASWYDQDLANYLAFGAPIGGGLTQSAAISASDAWQVDKKIDDSKPATGKVLGMKPAFASTPNCTLNPGADANATYNITYKGIACSLMMSIGVK